jgi:hypothetical protein
MWRLRGIDSLSLKDIQQSPGVLFHSLLASCKEKSVENILYNLQSMLVLLDKADLHDDYSQFTLKRKALWIGLFDKHYSLGDINEMNEVIGEVIDRLITENHIKKAHKILKLYFQLNQSKITLNKVERQFLFIKFRLGSKSFDNVVKYFLDNLDESTNPRKGEIEQLRAINNLNKLMEISKDEDKFVKMRESVKEEFASVYKHQPTPSNKRDAELIAILLPGTVWKGFLSQFKWPSENFHYNLLEIMLKVSLENATYTQEESYTSCHMSKVSVVTIRQQYTRVGNIIQHLELMKFKQRLE